MIDLSFLGGIRYTTASQQHSIADELNTLVYTQARLSIHFLRATLTHESIPWPISDISKKQCRVFEYVGQGNTFYFCIPFESIHCAICKAEWTCVKNYECRYHCALAAHGMWSTLLAKAVDKLIQRFILYNLPGRTPLLYWAVRRPLLPLVTFCRDP